MRVGEVVEMSAGVCTTMRTYRVDVCEHWVVISRYKSAVLAMGTFLLNAEVACFLISTTPSGSLVGGR